ncbi:uncharacterized protein LOC112325301 [Populus trichocarpa]|uniref:uncharacterized protein LOC112325301 n=1 Tax=Populus trichocarpa TaxID=3694 RepID=UPI000D189F52|nr:uncharacterized protein LOC112325301 [Populus trichocarpa]|eukprot:XP_024447231.1 uncharacterized protein LOC112325301 [Populus trichocarpa]
MEVNMSFSNDMDDEYEKLFRRLNPPRVVIDNEACKNATVIRVRVLVSFFGGCVLFSLDHHSCCFLGTKYFIVLQVHSASKHGTLLCGILIHVQILIHIKS